MVGRPPLYETKVKPRLSDIEKWAREGSTHKEIAAALNIGYSTFTLYLKENEELRDIVENAQMSGVPEVKHALWKRATGYDYEEKKTYIKQAVNEEERKIGDKIQYTEIIKKHCPPDVSAIAMFLRNNGDDWRDKDAKTYSLKEQELELRKMLSELQEWK